jgi:hypothetical protein
LLLLTQVYPDPFGFSVILSRSYKAAQTGILPAASSEKACTVSGLAGKGDD